MQTEQTVISIEFEPETVFIHDKLKQGIEGGSLMIVGKFFDAKTQELFQKLLSCNIGPCLETQEI